jgi:hypothetical protein
MNKHDEIIKFLGKIYINLKRSEIAYQNYMDNDKKFIYAKILKSCNEKILHLLIDNAYLLSDELIKESIKLVFHLDIWIEKWNDLEKKQKPKFEDEFVFENKFTFPREAAQNLENEFLKIRNKKD